MSNNNDKSKGWGSTMSNMSCPKSQNTLPLKTAETLATTKMPAIAPAPPMPVSELMDSTTISSLISRGVREALQSQSNYRQPNIVINNGSQNNHKKKQKNKKNQKVIVL